MRQTWIMPTDITRAEVQRLLDGNAQLVEVLPAEEYAQEHLPGALNIPLESLTSEVVSRTLAADRPVIVYCQDVQ